MNDEAIARLKADNERLSKIISIVVEQNELLKLENSFLKKAVTPKDIINSFAKIGMALKDKENVIAKLGEGLPNVPADPENIKDGINDVQIGIVDNKEGNNSVATDVVNMKEGISNVTGGIANVDDAVKNLSDELPAIIEPSDKIIWALEKELKASGYNRIRDSGVNNAAKLLLHFYNKGEGDYPKLKKITGHSTDGIAKFIMSMKKRGWIHRYGFQRFGVSENGVVLIKQALSKSREN